MNPPFEYQAAIGRDGLSAVNKFGFQSAIGTSAIAVWDRAAAYNYISAATAVNVTSANTNDTAAGTGARTATVYGLDGNYAAASETVTLNGQTIVTTTQTFLRVFRAVVNTAGSGGTNAGIIYVFTGTETSGVPDDTTKIYAQVTAGEGQSLMAVYTVPAGVCALCTKLAVSGDTSKEVTVRLVARPLGGAFATKDKYLVEAGFAEATYKPPKKFDEKTDIEVRAAVSTATTEVSAGFDLILVPKLGGDP